MKKPPTKTKKPTRTQQRVLVGLYWGQSLTASGCLGQGVAKLAGRTVRVSTLCAMGDWIRRMRRSNGGAEYWQWLLTAEGRAVVLEVLAGDEYFRSGGWRDA